jgi:hypothetical protein
MGPDPLDRAFSTESHPTLDYAPVPPQVTRRWWQGSVWDWLGSLGLVLLAITVIILAFMGLAYFWMTLER